VTPADHSARIHARFIVGRCWRFRSIPMAEAAQERRRDLACAALHGSCAWELRSARVRADLLEVVRGSSSISKL